MERKIKGKLIEWKDKSNVASTLAKMKIIWGSLESDEKANL